MSLRCARPSVSDVSRNPGRPKGFGWLMLAGILSLRTLQANVPIAPSTLPVNPTVTSGQASFAQPKPQSLEVNQSSAKANITWQSFSIGEAASVRFNMPSSDALTINRVSGNEATVIAGRLSSNGQVFVSNPNGILISSSARVETAGFLATTHQLTDIGYDNSLKLTSPGRGSVENFGSIESAAGGYVVLASTRVSNQGVISTLLGTTALVAGEQIELTLGRGIPIDVKVTRGYLDALVENRQAIVADGGTIILTAKGAEQALNSAVNNDGVLQARTVESKNGRIFLLGNGSMKVAGKLDASAPNGGDGGQIETSAPSVNIAPDVVVTTRAQIGKSGTWLIDPTDFTIGSGSATLSTSGIGATTLSASLESGNVAIATSVAGTGNGDIYVNAPVSWAANNKLTLSAHGDVIINSPITASGASGSVMFEFGLGSVTAGNLSDYIVHAPINLKAGNNFSTRRGSDGTINQFLVVTALGTFGDTSGTTLQGLQPYLNNYPPYAYVAIGADIDATPTSAWESGRGFLPLDSASMLEFTGLGHRIDGLHISRTSTTSVGLFSISYCVIKDLGITNSYISGGQNVGPISGDGGSTAFINCFTSNCFVRSNSNGPVSVGGIAGSARCVIDSYAENVEIHAAGGKRAGGITGSTGTGAGGGHLNDLPSNVIIRCWSSGVVHGADEIGGLVGTNFGHVADSYSVAIVYSDNSSSYVGGIAGKNWYGSISNCHSMSNIVGTSQGWFGTNYFTNCYAAYQSAQYVYPNNGTTVTGIYVLSGSSRAQSSYTNFDFTNTWWMKEGFTRPMLRSEARNYIFNSHQLQLVAMQPSGNYVMRYDLDLTLDLIDNLAYYRNIWSGQGFASLGDASTPFTGFFDGAGHTINSLVIATPSANAVGLFGTVIGGSISNLTLTAADVSGALDVGQLVGLNDGGIISQAHANGISAGTGRVGGLIGRAIGNSNVSDSSSTGTVNDTGSRAGGLIGENNSATSSINRSFSTNTVNGTTLVGGLVGYHVGDIYDAYARGNVNGTTEVGGLIGRIDGGTISRVYSRGRVSGTGSLGGLVGVKNGTSNFSYAYWEIESSYQPTSPAGTSFTYSIKTKHSTYAGFDFANIWGISVNLSYPDTYPELRSQTSGQYLQTPIYVRPNTGSSVYGETPSFTYGLYYQPDGSGQTVTGATISGSPTWTGVPTNTSAAGNYAISYNTGLSITFSSGYYTLFTENPTLWQVTARPLTLTAGSFSKTYGSLDPSFTYAVQTTGTGVGLINGDSVSGSLTRIAGENVGSYAINQGALSVTNSGNYAITYTPRNLTIGQRAITLAATAASKIYGNMDPSLGVSITAGSLGSATVSDALADVTGTITRVAGENVGNYAISLGSGIKAGNYAISYTSGNLTIAQRTITLAATAASKTYGNVDPSLGVSITTGSLGSATVSDTLANVTGTITRVVGENVGSYAISLGSGTKAGNYAISYTSGNLTIGRRAISLTANAASKNLGNIDPTLSVSITAGSLGSTTVSDTLANVTGTLTRAPGENAGNYAIALGSGSKAANYTISFTPGALTIRGNSKPYCGITEYPEGLEPETLLRPKSTSDDGDEQILAHIMTPEEGDEGDLFLRPSDVKKAKAKPRSALTIIDGGVKLPSDVRQYFYQQTSK